MLQSLAGMLTVPQFFVWRLTWNAVKNKFDKMPCFPDGSKYHMDASDKRNWRSFNDACSILATLRSQQPTDYFTLGFYLTADTGYWFLDIDECVSNGQLSPFASELWARFPGAAYEWSSSRTGMHIFGRGSVPTHRNKPRKGGPLIEFYTNERGIAFSPDGQAWGNADLDCTVAVADLVAEYLTRDESDDIAEGVFSTADTAWNGPTDDVALLDRVDQSTPRDAAAVFAGRQSQAVTFEDLWECNETKLLQHYGDDRSSWDAAMIGHLMFWTGRDAPRIERIMRQSNLYRSKWDEQRAESNFLGYSIVRLCREHAQGNRAVYGASRSSPMVDAVATPVPTATLASAPRMEPQVAEQSSVEISSQVDPGKWELARHGRERIQAAADPESLEIIARQLQADARMTMDLAYSLGSVLLERFEILGDVKPIAWCRAILQPSKVVVAADGNVRKLHPLTEFGNTWRFLERFDKQLMYVPDLENWYRWDETFWRHALPAEMVNLAVESIKRQSTHDIVEVPDEQRGEFYKYAMNSQTHSMAKNIVALSASDSRTVVRASRLDASSHLLGVPNGAIDLRTGALIPPDRDHRLTLMAGSYFDPRAACPWFEHTVLDAFFGDDMMSAFFQRVIGYALMGNPIEQKLIIPWGMGANAKSTIFTALQRALGSYAQTGAADTFTSVDGQRAQQAGGPREDLVRLRTARLLFISEIEENSQLKENMVKSLTGNEPIIARGQHAKHSVEFQPAFVPFMLTNHRPIVKGTDNGIWRRLLLVPFERNFETDPTVQRDEHRASKLATETPGILRWVVQGAINYQAHGLVIPERVKDASDEYRSDMDVLREWIDERCELGDDYKTNATDLFQSWRAWSEPRGSFRWVANQTAFGRKMEARGFVKLRNKEGIRGSGYVGIRVKSLAAVKFGP